MKRGSGGGDRANARTGGNINLIETRRMNGGRERKAARVSRGRKEQDIEGKEETLQSPVVTWKEQEEQAGAARVVHRPGDALLRG